MTKVEKLGVIALINFVAFATLLGYMLQTRDDRLLVSITFTLSMFIAFFMWSFFVWDNQKYKKKEDWDGEHP